MSRVLFVNKDPATIMLVPLAEVVKSNRHEVFVITEGLAKKAWQRAHFNIYYEGTDDFTVEPFPIDAEAELKNINPSCVIVGESCPIHMEETFGFAANTLGIPLIFVEDFWGGFMQSKARPDYILTIDEYAKELAFEKNPHANIVIVGNRAVLSKMPEISTSLREKFIELNKTFFPIVTFIGGFMTDDVEFCIKCIKKTPKSCVIPRYHPKYIFEKENGRTKKEIWDAMFSVLGHQVIDTEELQECPPEHVIAISDVVASALSGLLTTSASLGKTTICLESKEARNYLQNNLGAGFTEPVQVALGLAHKISRPRDLTKISSPSELARAKLMPFSPKKAYDAISHLL